MRIVENGWLVIGEKVSSGILRHRVELGIADDTTLIFADDLVSHHFVDQFLPAEQVIIEAREVGMIGHVAVT